MNRPGKRNWWITFVLVGVAVVAIVIRLRDHEPRFEGRKLSAWLDDPALAGEEMQRGIGMIGTNAIPQLRQWLLQKPSMLERSIHWLGRKSEYFNSDFHPSLDAHFRGMRGFFLLGERAAPAVPWLEAQAALKDEDFEFYLKALAVCGPEGAGALDRTATGLNRQERSSLINALAFGIASSGERNPSLITRLTSCMDDPDRDLRLGTLWAVRNLRHRCPPELVTALQRRAEEDSDINLRATAKLLAGELAHELMNLSPGTNDGQIPEPASPDR